MHSVLVASLLASGLAAGDGGYGGADPGRVCLDFEGDWEGTGREEAGRPYPVRLANGILYQGVGKGRFQPLCSCSLVPESGDRIEVVLGKQRCPGIYRPDGRGVRICFSSDPAKRPTSFRPGHNRGVWTLRRPDPLKK